MNDLIPETLKHDCQDYTFQLASKDFDNLWSEISGKNSDDIAGQALVTALGSGRYVMDMMGADYLLDTQTRSVTGPLDRMPPDKRVLLGLAFYLNGATAATLSGNMVPETVLPGGDRFFSGTHALKRDPILNRFAAAGEEFIEAAKNLGAEVLSSGPDSFGFTIKLLPKILVQVVLWPEDDEFPAQLNFAFDDSASRHTTLGALASLVSILNDQLVLIADQAVAK
jgi:hypothetical protein